MGWDGMGWLSLDGAIYRAPTVLKTERWGELQGHLEPFHSIFGIFIASRRKTNLRAFHLENFCCQNSATWKVFVFCAPEAKHASWKLFSPEINQFFMTRS